MHNRTGIAYWLLPIALVATTGALAGGGIEGADCLDEEIGCDDPERQCDPETECCEASRWEGDPFPDSTPSSFRLTPSLPGSTGTPVINWGGARPNGIGTSGPAIRGSVNGAGGGGTVFLGNGASSVRDRDFRLSLNGINWSHFRVYSSKGTAAPTAYQGEGWWSNEMKNITGTAGDEDDNDCDLQFDPHYTIHFTNTATSTWTCDDNFLYTLTYSSGSDEFTVTRPDGFKWVFHDLNVTNTEGLLKRIEDPYANDLAFTYSSGQLTDTVADVVEGEIGRAHV